MLRKLIEDIGRWYRGLYVPPPTGVLTHIDRFEQPPIANVLRSLGHFCLQHWQWILGTALAVLAIIVAG
jgi:hypothetical protein